MSSPGSKATAAAEAIPCAHKQQEEREGYMWDKSTILLLTFAEPWASYLKYLKTPEYLVIYKISMRIVASIYRTACIQ
jgi:hypothetical protein